VARNIDALLKAAALVRPRLLKSGLRPASRVEPVPHASGVVMNKKQRAVLAITAIVVIAMLVYPPFHGLLLNGIVRGLGYSWIWNPPQFSIGSTELESTVNVGLLVAQWLGALIVGGIAYLLCKN